jgi:hypothetical protein
LACVGVVVWYSFPLLPLVATLFLVGGMLCILEAHD